MNRERREDGIGRQRVVMMLRDPGEAFARWRMDFLMGVFGE